MYRQLCRDVLEFIDLGPERDFKFELITTEDSGNQTFHEGEFSLDGDDDDDDDNRPWRTWHRW